MPTPLYGNQSTTTLYSPQNVSSGGSTTSTILAYRVKDIILDDTHKDFKKYELCIWQILHGAWPLRALLFTMSPSDWFFLWKKTM